MEFDSQETIREFEETLDDVEEIIMRAKQGDRSEISNLKSLAWELNRLEDAQKSLEYEVVDRYQDRLDRLVQDLPFFTDEVDAGEGAPKGVPEETFSWDEKQYLIHDAFMSTGDGQTGPWFLMDRFESESE